MDKDEALAAFEQTRRQLLTILANMPDRIDLTDPVEGEWTIKDILGHITAWELTLIQPMQSLIMGKPFSPEIVQDGEAYNRDHAQRRLNLPIDEINKEMHQVRGELIRLAAQLPDAVWQNVYEAPWGGRNTLSGLVYGLALHESEHTHAIVKWLEGK